MNIATQQRQRAFHGFTLMELLVVVAIIGILAALLTSSIGPLKSRMQQQRCANNLKQIGVGLFAYAAEHDNTIPPVYLVSPSSANGQQDFWNWVAWTYVYPGTTPQYPEYDTQFSSRATVKWRDNAFRCPTTRYGAIKAPTVGSLSDARMSYGLNNTMMIVDASGNWQDGRTSAIPLSRVTQAGQTAMVLEASAADASFSTWMSTVGLIPHNGGTNILFFDGHVEWRTFSAIPTGGWSVYKEVFWRGY